MKSTFHGDENGMCVLNETKYCNDCGECDRCDIDPTKICDNCGKCLDSYNTNSKGFVEIPIDKIIMDENDDTTLNQFYKEMGLDDEDDDTDE